MVAEKSALESKRLSPSTPVNRDDVEAGNILPHLIENNIWVPPALRINVSTKREHLAREKLTSEEIARLYGD